MDINTSSIILPKFLDNPIEVNLMFQIYFCMQANSAFVENIDIFCFLGRKEGLKFLRTI